jgi:hypothetical protein
MVRLLGGGLFASHGFFPLSVMALGFSWKRKTRGREMMEVWTSGFAEHQRVIFISSRGASGVMTGQCALMRIPNDGVFFLGCLKSFQQNSVYDSRMDFLQIMRQGGKYLCIFGWMKVSEFVRNNKTV